MRGASALIFAKMRTRALSTKFRMKIYLLYIYFACLSVCLFACFFVSNKRQNG